MTAHYRTEAEDFSFTSPLGYVTETYPGWLGEALRNDGATHKTWSHYWATNPAGTKAGFFEFYARTMFIQYKEAHAAMIHFWNVSQRPVLAPESFIASGQPTPFVEQP